MKTIEEIKNEKKGNLKSVRLSDTVFNYITKYEGDGFNEKFENIILFAMHKEKEIKEELKRLETVIERKKNELEELGKQEIKIRNIRNSLNTIDVNLNCIENHCKSLAENIIE